MQKFLVIFGTHFGQQFVKLQSKQLVLQLTKKKKKGNQRGIGYEKKNGLITCAFKEMRSMEQMVSFSEEAFPEIGINSMSSGGRRRNNAKMSRFCKVSVSKPFN